MKEEYLTSKTLIVEQSENGCLWFVRELTNKGDFILQVCITKKEAQEYKKWKESK